MTLVGISVWQNATASCENISVNEGCVWYVDREMIWIYKFIHPHIVIPENTWYIYILQMMSLCCHQCARQCTGPLYKLIICFIYILYNMLYIEACIRLSNISFQLRCPNNKLPPGITSYTPKGQYRNMNTLIQTWFLHEFWSNSSAGRLNMKMSSDQYWKSHPNTSSTQNITGTIGESFSAKPIGRNCSE